MKYNPNYNISTFEVGEILDEGGVTFPGSASLNIPALVNEVAGGKPKDIVHPSKPGAGNIKNSSARSMVSGGYTTCNYITVPCYLELGHLDKGSKVIVIFVGGDITHPVIISPY